VVLFALIAVGTPKSLCPKPSSSARIVSSQKLVGEFSSVGSKGNDSMMTWNTVQQYEWSEVSYEWNTPLLCGSVERWYPFLTPDTTHHNDWALYGPNEEIEFIDGSTSIEEVKLIVQAKVKAALLALAAQL
jgi:hypothetical protein